MLDINVYQYGAFLSKIQDKIKMRNIVSGVIVVSSVAAIYPLP